MKRILSYIIAILLTVIFAMPIQSVSASTNDFYFEDAEFDYYLSKNSDGTSNMHVKEVLTAVFPSTNQNHGITRSIPYTNQDGKNLTIDSYHTMNLSVKRNGIAENVAKWERENGNYIIYIGKSSEYVHGTQVYTLEYDFNNVITAFDESRNMAYGSSTKNIEELYWDTNGDGWSQVFNKLTARVHLPSDIAKNLTESTLCYVGRYGSTNSSRCTISSNDETTYNQFAANATSEKSAETVITFETGHLAPRETLTFVIDFKGDTFAVPEPRKTYIAFVFFGIEIIVVGLFTLWTILSFTKHFSSKRKLKKSLFTKPEYTPPKDLTVAEAGIVSMRSTKPTRVATLLEMAIRGNIELIKTEKTGILKNKQSWNIKVKKLAGLTSPELDVLEILNGGSTPKDGDTIIVKKHRATSHLESINRDYDISAKSMLKNKGLYENSARGLVAPLLSITFLPFAFIYAIIFLSAFSADGAVIVVGIAPIIIASVIIFLSFEIFSICVLAISSKLSHRTEKGIEMSNYLDGLRLYISMAEKDRIKFLQSVKGVDTSNKGICKLYEKLLPYACMFGLEESWLAELNKYYDIVPDYNHGWYSGTDVMTFAMFHSMMSTASSTITSSTSYTSTSSSSSSSFGGGGGGFSGGGGGGGGGGGW